MAAFNSVPTSLWGNFSPSREVVSFLQEWLTGKIRVSLLPNALATWTFVDGSKEPDERRQGNKLIESPATVYQKSCHYTYTVKHWNWASLVKPTARIFVLGQGPLLLQTAGGAFFYHPRKSIIQVEKPKCAHWEFPTVEAPAKPMKSGLFFTSPLAKGCPGCFSFSLDGITQG